MRRNAKKSRVPWITEYYWLPKSTIGSGLGLTQIDERFENEGIINTLIGAIFNLILNHFLIPIINIESAAIAFLLGSIMSGYLASFTNKSHKSLAFKYYLNPILQCQDFQSHGEMTLRQATYFLFEFQRCAKSLVISKRCSLFYKYFQLISFL